MDLVQVRVHLLLLPQGQVLLIDLFLSFELACLHVFKLNLPCNEGATLLASGVSFTQLENTIGV